MRVHVLPGGRSWLTEQSEVGPGWARGQWLIHCMRWGRSPRNAGGRGLGTGAGGLAQEALQGPKPPGLEEKCSNAWKRRAHKRDGKAFSRKSVKLQRVV